jgi:hypothetical protein
MNESVLGDEDRATYNAAVVNSGEFTEIFRENSVVVWKRTSSKSAVAGSTPASPTTIVPAPTLPAAATVPPLTLPPLTLPSLGVPGPPVPSVPAAATVSPVTSVETVGLDPGIPVISDP